MRNKAIVIILFLVFSAAFGVIGSHAQTRPRKSANAIAARKTLRLPEERRKQVEAMMLRGEYQHDGSEELASIGTIESVPALLKVLKDHPGYDTNGSTFSGGGLPRSGNDRNGDGGPDDVQPVDPPKPGRMIYICTYAHAVSALRKITGQNLFEYEDWVEWWKKYPKNPR